VGTLDILAAFLYYFIRTGNNKVFNVLRYVASGFFGKEAISGGGEMIVAGVLFHYLIAFAFTLFFFWLFPHLKALSINKILIGIVYGIFVWAIMNLVVVPLSRIGSQPFNTINVLSNLLILIVCMGIPLSIMATNFYKRRA
jgi:uncharacterized membrane protein YagU involved in acid resistance